MIGGSAAEISETRSKSSTFRLRRIPEIQPRDRSDRIATIAQSECSIRLGMGGTPLSIHCCYTGLCGLQHTVAVGGVHARCVHLRSLGRFEVHVAQTDAIKHLAFTYRLRQLAVVGRSTHLSLSLSLSV